MDPFEYPEDLTALDPDALATAEEAALAEFDRLRALGDDITDEQIEEMERLAAHVAAIRAEGEARVQAAADRQARVEAAAASLSTEPPEEEPAEEGEEEGEGDEDEEEPTAEGSAEAEEQDPVPVTASARRPQSLVRRTPKQAVVRPANSRRAAVLTAAADVQGFAASQRLADLTEVAKAFAARSKGLPQTRIGGKDGTRLQYAVASLSRGLGSYDGLSITNPKWGGDEQALVAAAAKEARLPGGSLVAAGGWCAPSETIYDLCENRASLDGLWDVPEINVSRGGIRYTKGPDFTSMFDNGFWLTEAEIIAGTLKTCVEITCPPFVEIRLDAVGICIKAPILTNTAYPELVRAWIEGTLIGQQDAVSAALLQKAAASAGAAVAVGGAGTSVSHDTLTALELVGEGMRQREHMAFNESVEVVLPVWMRSAIKADLAVRTGQPAPLVSNEQVQSHFANRGLRVQWVYNWEPLTVDANGVATAYPTNVDALVYPAGTFVKGTEDVISLDTVYDSTDLLSNMYTAAFVEEGVLLAETCGSAALVTLPVCVNGRTGAADIVECFPEAGV